MRNPDDKSKGFQISSSHQSFADKQKNVFDQLSIAEKNTKNLLKKDEPMDADYNSYLTRREQRSETKYLRGRESIFKRPEAPISRCLPPGRTPDFKKNPQRWTKYSLEDVRDEDMSERGNAAAAMSFLRELEERKEKDEDKLEELPVKITFKKSAMIRSRSRDCEADFEDESPSNSSSTKGTTNSTSSTSSTIVSNTPASTFRNSKVVMPEYVVGQKIKKDKKNREKRNVNASKQLKLDHLDEEDEES